MWSSRGRPRSTRAPPPMPVVTSSPRPQCWNRPWRRYPRRPRISRAACRSAWCARTTPWHWRASVTRPRTVRTSPSTDYYDQAQQMLADCAQSGNGGEQAQDAQERQQESQEESQQQEDSEEQQGGQSDDSGQDSQEESPSESPQENQSPSSGDSGEDSSASPSTNPRQEELEERNREAQESREAQEQKSGGGDGSGQNW